MDPPRDAGITPSPGDVFPARPRSANPQAANLRGGGAGACPASDTEPRCVRLIEAGGRGGGRPPGPTGRDRWELVEVPGSGTYHQPARTSAAGSRRETGGCRDRSRAAMTQRTASS